MKARVISTNEIVDVVKDGYMYLGHDAVAYTSNELEIMLDSDREQLRGELLAAALQGMLANPNRTGESDEFLVEHCIRIANMAIDKINQPWKDIKANA